MIIINIVVTSKIPRFVSNNIKIHIKVVTFFRGLGSKNRKMGRNFLLCNQLTAIISRSKISEVKFRYLLRLFALDLTASDTARLTGLSVRAVNDLYLRCATGCWPGPRASGAGRGRRTGRELLRPAAGARQTGARRGRQNHRLRPVQTRRAGLHGNRPGLLEKDAAGHDSRQN